MPETQNILLKTFGCQMNRLDSELILGALEARGWVPAVDADDADAILLNTCSVRLRAEEKVLSYLGGLKKLKAANPALLIGVIGCMAVNRERDLRALDPRLGLICGPGNFHRLPELLDRAMSGETVVETDATAAHPQRHGTARPNSYSASIAAMRGCDNFCAYCIVPYVRGRETSRPLAEIVAEARRLVDDGCVEITLLGQCISAYGKNLAPRADLADLLRAVGEIDGLRRLQFITSHPATMNHKILDAMAQCHNVSRYLHLPAQSGADRILAKMKRGYDLAHYLDLLDYARRVVPDIEIASDFIVGFPGETEADYAATRALVERADYLNCFVFKYSPRPGTAAANMPDDVPREEKKRRNNDLLAVQEQISLRRRRALIGTTLEVLVEGPSRKNPDVAVGRTVHNFIVHFAAPDMTPGRFVEVEITDATPLTVSGQLKIRETA